MIYKLFNVVYMNKLQWFYTAFCNKSETNISIHTFIVTKKQIKF